MSPRSRAATHGSGMTTIWRVALLAAVFPVVPLGYLRAQEPRPLDLPVAGDSTALYEITLRDGTKVTGHVIAVGGGGLTIRTLGGVELTLRRGDIATVRRAAGIRVGNALWPVDPSDSRLFLGPTARVPGNGRGYVGVYELFFVSGAIGLGDVAMFSGGVSLFPGVDVDEQIFYLAPKVRVLQTDYVQVAAAVFWLKPLTDSESAGMVFGGITAGTDRAAFSGGLGFPFGSQSGFAEQQLMMFGADLRVSRRLKLITENWAVPGEDDAVLSGGARIIFDGATIEVAAATTTAGGGFLPIVNFSLSW